jgi:hypothetical protein
MDFREVTVSWIRLLTVREKRGRRSGYPLVGIRLWEITGPAGD